MALFFQPCFTSKSWGRKCNVLGSVLMFCTANSHLLKELFHARLTFNFLLCVYILEGVRVVVLEILMRDNISDSKDSGSSLLIFLPDPSDCRKFCLGHSLATGCYVNTELLYAACHLELLLFCCWRAPRVAESLQAAITGMCL